MWNIKNNNNANSAMSGVAWKFAERILAQGISFLVSIVLARLLLPEQYGTISLVLVFINIANVFVTNGLGLSLIQKKNADDDDFTTIFYCSIILGIVLYTIIYISAPFIGDFYSNKELCVIIRVLGIKIIIASINSIQQAYISKHFLFQKFFFATLFGTIFSGILGVILAYKGFGVWSLVAQYLSNSLVDTIFLAFSIDWRPKLLFSISRAKVLLSYAWKLMTSGFINTTFSQLKNLIIGKVYTETDLAFYEKGNYFPQIVINNLNSAISDVLFPYMAKSGDNVTKVKQFAQKSLRLISYVVTPCVTGLVVIAEDLVTVLLTEKWLPCVPFFRIMCLYWLTQPLQTVNWQSLKAIGRSDLCLKLEILKKGISIVVLFLVMKISVMAIAIASVGLAILSALINAIPVTKLINYSLRNQFLDVLPSFFASAIMAIILLPISLIHIPQSVALIIYCSIGIGIYILISKLLHISEYEFLIEKLNQIYVILKKERIKK